jgi:hypothetical protein
VDTVSDEGGGFQGFTGRSQTLPDDDLVPQEGIEPPLPYENQILNLARLPVPPLGHTGAKMV